MNHVQSIYYCKWENMLLEQKTMTNIVQDLFKAFGNVMMIIWKSCVQIISISLKVTKQKNKQISGFILNISEFIANLIRENQTNMCPSVFDTAANIKL